MIEEYYKNRQYYITFGTPYSDAETTWKRYEYLCQTVIVDYLSYIKHYYSGCIIFLTKRHNISFVLRCVGKENNIYLFTRYMIPYYNSCEADMQLHVPSDVYDEEVDIKTNQVAFSNERFRVL